MSNKLKKREECVQVKSCPHMQHMRQHLFETSKLMREYRDKLIVESRMRSNAEQQMLTDPLTGALNRRGLEKNFLEQSSKSERAGTSLFLLFMDVDNFGRFNKEYGEKTGDMVLVDVVKTIRENVRPYDSVYRLGGEEFVVLLPELKSYITACKTAERVRKKVEAVKITPHTGGEPTGITISMGVSQLNEGEPLDVLIDRADKAMRQSKETGKNKSCAYFGPQVEEVTDVLHKAMVARKEIAKKRLNTMFRKAAKQGDLHQVVNLLARGADVNSGNKDGWTALMWASREGREITRVLLDNGAEIDATNKLGWTALMVAARYGSKGAVELLIQLKADLYARDSQGRTALSHAISRGHKEVAEKLKRAMAIGNFSPDD